MRTRRDRSPVRPSSLAHGGAHTVFDPGYWRLSTRPLHILVFLLPLLALYEVGTLFFLSGQGMVEVVRARVLLAQVFDLFGAVGFHLPPILLAVVLVIWHVLSGDKTRVRMDVVVGMAAESFLWAVPLLVFGLVAGTVSVFAARGMEATPVEVMSPMARLTLALGAGIYEELLFRLILISLVHALLVDVMRWKDRAGFVVAALLSALAFTLYHNIRLAEGGVDVRLVALCLGAGVYFGALFITRGFGVVVATHAIYDIVVLMVLGRG